MRAVRVHTQLDNSVPRGLGETPDPMGALGLALIKNYMILVLPTAGEIEQLAARHGRYHRNPCEILEEREYRAHVSNTVKAAVLELPPVQIHVVVRRFGLFHSAVKTLREIARELRVSHVAVFKAQARAFDSLRNNPSLIALAEVNKSRFCAHY